MDRQLLTFAAAIKDAREWLEAAASELHDIDEECNHQWSEVLQALSLVPAALAAIDAVHAPLAKQIKRAEDDYAEQEARYGDGPQY